MTWLLNPDNGVFASLCRSWCCVDKTQVLAEINRLIEERPSTKLLITRPRHTGKSAFLGMLSTYYSCGAESDALFRTMRIASHESYRQQLNRYPVIFFDMACQFDDCRASESDVRKNTFAQWLERAFLADLTRTFPEENFSGSSFERALSRIMGLPRQPYILLIDNWDAPYRKTDMDFDADYSGYADFLRQLLYGVDGMKPVLTCFTGIFPFPDDWLKDPDWQSFQMSTMTAPGTCADWIGYTDEEVRHLAVDKDADPIEVVRHVGGYFFGKLRVESSRSGQSLFTL